MPHGAYRLHYKKPPLYYWAGVFYKPYSGGYISITAPIGARIHDLPASYVTLTFGSTNYYLANNVYYRRDHDGYVVVSAPSGSSHSESSTHSTHNNDYNNGDWAVYPNQGQSSEQLQLDRYQCHRWAKDQTGYDPTTSNSNPSQRSPYFRAQAACLEGRGYVVR